MSTKINKILLKAQNYASLLGGKKARQSRNAAEFMSRKPMRGFDSARRRIERVAKVDAGRTSQARVHFGTRVGVATGAAVIGSNAYRTHQDNKILRRIDKLYT